LIIHIPEHAEVVPNPDEEFHVQLFKQSYCDEVRDLLYPTIKPYFRCLASYVFGIPTLWLCIERDGVLYRWETPVRCGELTVQEKLEAVRYIESFFEFEYCSVDF
jgi:hypothetical protein